jgi:hypothetical protein
MKPIPDYCDLMTIENWIDLCKDGVFIDYDGFGYFSDGEVEFDEEGEVYPSMLKHPKKFNPKHHKFIAWYNR